MNQIELFNENKNHCVWTNIGEKGRVNQVWKYSCDSDSVFYGHILKSDFKYCPYCGKTLELKVCADERKLSAQYDIQVQDTKRRA